MKTKKNTSASRAAHLRREIDVLVQAHEGLGASALFRAIVVEAVAKDVGDFESSNGEPGYVWKPERYHDRSDPVAHRITAAGCSLGRIIAGGGCDRRTYSAFLEGIYEVVMSADDNIGRRIEELWHLNAELPEPELERPPAGMLRRFFNWLRSLWKPSVHHQYLS